MCLALNFTEVTHAQEWRKIIPLHSTRADVERLLGKEVGRKSPILYYQEKFNVLVTYADGLPCDENEKYGWKLPKDTVVHFTVFFKPGFAVKLSEFGFDLGKFREMPDECDRSVSYYDSEEEGVLLQFSGGWVSNITYRARKRDWGLMCQPPAAPNNSFNRSGNSAAFIR